MLEIRLRSFPRNRVIWFAEEAVVEPDRFALIRFQQAAQEPRLGVDRHTTVSAFSTLLTDLTVSEDALYGAIHKRARRNIDSTIDDPRIEIAWLREDVGDEHYRLLASFMAGKQLWVPRRAVFTEYVRRGVISSCRVNGELVAMHVNLVDPESGRARLIWSARTLAECEIPTAKLNKLVHWRGLLHFRDALKLRTYDWGGVALNDGALSGIDEFKLQFGGRLVTEWNVEWESPLYSRLQPVVASARHLLRPAKGGWQPVTGE